MSFVDVPTKTVVEGQAGATGGRLAALRAEKGLSTGELAKLAGVSHDEIVAIESGKPMSADDAHAIAAALNLPADQLLD